MRFLASFGRRALPAILLLFTSAAAQQPEPKAEEVTFPAEGRSLHGFLYKPPGKGPFPAILYNHGSEKKPGWVPPLAQFYVPRGYVLFVPHRHGHGRSPGDYIGDLQDRLRAETKDRGLIQQRDVELHELYNRDVVAAVRWLQERPYVDRQRVVMTGLSYGGIQTLLTAEQGLGLRGFVPFAPAAMSWAGNPKLRERLRAAVRNARAPVFLLQADNDYNLGPSKLLGPELDRLGPPNRHHVYPAFGSTPQDGHGGFAVRGSAVWGKDVLVFIREVTR